MLLQMDFTRTETSLFGLQGVKKLRLTVVQRRSLSQNSGKLSFVGNNDFPVLGPHLI